MRVCVKIVICMFITDALGEVRSVSSAPFVTVFKDVVTVAVAELRNRHENAAVTAATGWFLG